MSKTNVFLIGLFMWVSGWAQTRMIPHVTRAAGGFSTHIQIHGLDSSAHDWALEAFDAQGLLLAAAEGTIAAGGFQSSSIADLFGIDEVSHIRIVEGDEVMFTAGYQATGEASGIAHVVEEDRFAQAWRVPAGSASVTWDGIAVVNLDDGAVDIRVVQFDGQGRLLNDRSPASLSGIAPSGKGLLVFSQAFSPVEGSFYEVQSTGDITITALRGDLDGSRFLWSNAAIPMTSPLATKTVFSSTRDGNEEIYILNEEDGELRRLTTHPAQDTEPEWSPDGHKIVFRSHRSGDGDLYVMDTDGSNLQQLTSHPALDGQPVWSPDGQQIAFSSLRSDSGRPEVFVIDVESQMVTQLTFALGVSPSWSPSGSQIVFQTLFGNNNDLSILSLIDGSLTRLTDSVAFDEAPDWSPDGTLIAFESDRHGNNEIYVMNADGTNVIRLTNHLASDENPKWSPDGKWLRFSSFRDGDFEIYALSVESGSLIRLTDSPADDEFPNTFIGR